MPGRTTLQLTRDGGCCRGATAEADPDGYDSEGGSPGADRAASEPLPVRDAANSHSMQGPLACCWRGVLLHSKSVYWICVQPTSS
jgi:hypothetical protein